MTSTVRLRPWQKEALDLFSAMRSVDFLAVATPGAGKTAFALTAVRHRLATHPGRVVIVAPTEHLKVQWAAAAAHFDLHMEPFWSASDGRLPRDAHGIVTTYQQVATSAHALRKLADAAVVILDEVHHAGHEKAWGDGVRVAFDAASCRLALSGTPFRSDTTPIPWVRYVDDVAAPDFEYGYAQALEDGGVVRPVYFPRLDGHMEWVSASGAIESAAFSDELDRGRAAQRLRTALSPEGEWLPTVLGQAHQRLVEIREVHSDAAGLVIASNRDHARAISRILHDRLGVKATVVTSDDKTASARIGAFAACKDPWIVAVRMVSEGVDIPRLHVGVFATTTTTDLFFRQAVGRVVRWTPGPRGQAAYMFIPDDARLRALAFSIAEQRRHVLRRAEGTDEALPRRQFHGDEPTEQLSLFAALSATPLEATAATSTPNWEDAAMDVLAGIDVTLPPPPPLPGVTATSDASPTDPPAHVQRKRLRAANRRMVPVLSGLANLSHAQVNAELNRQAGIDKITEATADQLERRLAMADRWLKQLNERPTRKRDRPAED